MLDRRHVNKKATGQRDVRCDASAFAGDRLFRDLNNDLLAFAKELGNGGLRSAFAAVATALSITSTAIAVSMYLGLRHHHVHRVRRVSILSSRSSLPVQI